MIMVRRRPLLLAVFLTVLFGILFTGRYGVKEGSQLKPHIEKVEHFLRPAGPKAPCEEHLGWLEPYSFSYPINYVSRDIIAVPDPESQRPPLTVINEPLLADFSTVDLSQSQTLRNSKCLPPLSLKVSRVAVPPQDASNMIFGMQTTMGRLKSTVKHLARWLPNTNARLFAIVIENEETPADDAAMKALEKEFLDQGMNVTVMHPVSPTDNFPQRYFSLVSVMYKARTEKTDWVVCIDDDTFFPSMHDLAAMLKDHDPKKQQYIGSLSEDWWAVNHYGLMGFGGAGILLSTPLAKVVDEFTPWCKSHLRTSAGDISVMDCVYDHSTTKLTHIAGLHQVDMHGDLSGFYESGREMLSLHHWKEGSAAGYKLEMEKMHLVANICDNCFLQRWQFKNEFILSNGFSIAQYPQGQISGKKPGGVLGTGVGGSVDKIDLQAMEHTWGDDINVLHSLHPVRDKLPDDVKIGYKLLDSMLVDSDAEGQKVKDVVRQVYFKEGGEGVKDTVMVLNWHAGSA
ncbi:hypothetical protein HYALB_00001516 [Hymenoscyphus albidus]|uniref:Glycosyltransferase family 31 protein n=1 Tax=Hymenoscyphus albidus TaxID=595503 RepID=A0A9N9LE86_9HELO|nr:hypothetical protein HYALB_00001516 [Hymenoscyphus albidus]